MALVTTNSKHALGQLPMPVAQGAEIVAVRMKHNLSANPTANDVAWLGDLPQDHVPVDCILDAPDLDSNGAPTLTISVGVLNAGQTDLDDTWISASTVGQAGGIARPTLNNCVRVAPSATAKKSIGLKFPAAAATLAAGEIGLPSPRTGRGARRRRLHRLAHGRPPLGERLRGSRPRPAHVRP